MIIYWSYITKISTYTIFYMLFMILMFLSFNIDYIINIRFRCGVIFPKNEYNFQKTNIFFKRGFLFLDFKNPLSPHKKTLFLAPT